MTFFSGINTKYLPWYTDFTLVAMHRPPVAHLQDDFRAQGGVFALGDARGYECALLRATARLKTSANRMPQRRDEPRLVKILLPD